ncbi:MAG: pyridoxamine 5'-phosphate oxidase family protein [Polyangiaceae bacterium]
MQLAEVLSFVRKQRLAVQASVREGSAPQAAVVGIVASGAFEVFFDTLETSRKCENLRKNPRLALVIGWDLAEGRTVQLEGLADEPRGAELERLKALYFEAFPDGVERQQWAGITYVRVRPTWLRYSDFSGSEPRIVEFAADALAEFAGSAL